MKKILLVVVLLPLIMGCNSDSSPKETLIPSHMADFYKIGNYIKAHGWSNLPNRYTFSFTTSGAACYSVVSISGTEKNSWKEIRLWGPGCNTKNHQILSITEAGAFSSSKEMYQVAQKGYQDLLQVVK